MFATVCQLLWLFVLLSLFNPYPGYCNTTKHYNVLVVMSYHESFQWENEIRDGIASVLSSKSELRYVYLDTKRNQPLAADKARKLYELYKKIRPDGVIAVDDAAQSLFVVPYLKNKVATPVMFCGVNGDAADYGYPAANVSGVLERMHMNETLAFLKQLVPSVKTFCAVLKNDTTSCGTLRQLQHEASDYPVRFGEFVKLRTYQEALEAAISLRTKCDALYLASLDGLLGAAGEPLSSREIVSSLVKTFDGPVVAGISNDIRSGILCSVLETGQEQGAIAAGMLLKAMSGTPVSSLPVTVNRNGKRVINVTALNALGIKARPVVLRGAELVTTLE